MTILNKDDIIVTTLVPTSESRSPLAFPVICYFFFRVEPCVANIYTRRIGWVRDAETPVSPFTSCIDMDSLQSLRQMLPSFAEAHE